jgi:hypothetical protein
MLGGSALLTKAIYGLRGLLDMIVLILQVMSFHVNFNRESSFFFDQGPLSQGNF